MTVNLVRFKYIAEYDYVECQWCKELMSNSNIAMERHAEMHNG